MNKKQVFLLMTHLYSKEIANEFEKIQRATKNLGTSFILYHQKEDAAIDQKILQYPHYIVTNSSLSRLGYETVGAFLIPEIVFLSLIQFFREHRYQYYWCIENDVRFTGNWESLFLYFDDAEEDFLTCHIRKYSDEPDWTKWSTLSHPVERIESSKMIRSFNVIYRISWPALNYIDEMRVKGWKGYQEVFVPTLLYRGGFRLRDFGGTGEFVPSTDKNRFYIDTSTPTLRDGTIRYRPLQVFLFNKPRNKIVHPVKPMNFGQKVLYSAYLLLRYFIRPIKKKILISRHRKQKKELRFLKK